MDTPEEVSIDSTCWSCVPDKLTAILFVLARNAGMSDPATVSVESACWSCVPDKMAAILFLLANGGGSGSGGVVCQIGPPVDAPASGCGVSIDSTTGAIYIYRNGGWEIKV